MKMKNITRATAIALAVFLGLGLAGCGSSEPTATLSDIKVTGKVGAEPKISVPDNLSNVPNESFEQLRVGNGKPLTENHEITIEVQKLALDNPEKIHSSWGKKSHGEKMTIDLSAELSAQVPAKLRAMLLTAKVGEVIAYKTKAPRSALDEAAYTPPTDADIKAIFKDDEKTTTPEEEIEQLWIVTVTAAAKGYVKPKIQKQKKKKD